MWDDLETFNASLAKSMDDKLFFTKILERPDVVVDFGCGDGTLLKRLTQIWPGIYALGVETEPAQRRFAEDRLGENGKVVPNFSKNDLPADRIGPKVAVFSSVLHESPWLLAEATRVGFDWIAVRDMALRERDRCFEPYLEAIFKGLYRDGPMWEMEREERYFQNSFEDLTSPPAGYTLYHSEHYIYRPVAKMLSESVGFELTIPTHTKTIWRKGT